ncbi:MAG: methyltransferase domain-containing protein [Microcoleaceae cyanobacterium]
MQWNPEGYAKSSSAQLKWAQELRSHLNLQGHESILDLGCGDGKITADFARSLPNGWVTGVDNSAPMIAYAQRTYSKTEYPNLTFVEMDARALNFTPAFDLVFSNAVLHWVDDHQAVLRGVAQALKSGRSLVISCGGSGNAADILQTFAELAETASWKQYFGTFENPYHFCGTQNYETWLQAAGFAIDRLELVPKDMTHDGADGLAAWIRTTWMPITHQVPETHREQLIADFVAIYLQRFPIDAQGHTHVRMVRLEVEARKTP